MSEETTLIITIFLMAAVTYLPRALPLHIPSKIWPRWLKDCIDFLPVSLIGVITVPTLLVSDGALVPVSPGFLAFIPTAIVAYFSRNLIVSVVVGVITYTIINYLLS